MIVPNRPNPSNNDEEIIKWLRGKKKRTPEEEEFREDMERIRQASQPKNSNHK